MKLPNAHGAIVEPAKLLDYLLNAAHPDNGGKAAFFLELGFSRDDWHSLVAALTKLAASGEVTKSMESWHGRKYVLDGNLESPKETKTVVRTIWAIDRASDAPRLVTAYPLRKQKGQL